MGRAIKRSEFLAAAMLATLVSPRPSVAVEGVGVGDASGSVLEEVLVTAEKRSQDSLTIPASLSVLRGEALSENHVVDFDDLSRAVPGLSFAAGGAGWGVGEGLATIQMCGVSSNSGAATVAVYLDESSITVNNSYDGMSQPVPLDIDHIEVVRGPQGTLYGASAMGGAIRFLQNKPDLAAFGGFIASDLSGTDHGGPNYQESGVVNIPVAADRLALRAGFLYGHNSGWIGNEALDGQLNQSGVNSEQTKAARIAALLIPNDTLSVSADINYQRDDSKDSPVFFPALGLFRQDKEVREWAHDTMIVPSLTIVDQLGFAELTAVSSYFWRDMNRFTDGTYYNNAILAGLITAEAGLPFSKAIATLASPVNFPTSYSQISQELRLASVPADTKLTWVGGVYFSGQRVSHLNDEPEPALPAAFQAAYGFPITAIAADLGAPANLSSFNSIYHESTWTYTDQYAVFGQINYDVMPQLHAVAGLRYLLAREFYQRDGGGFYDIGNIAVYKSGQDYDAATPKFALSYDLDDSSLAYASMAKGFRLGGPTGPDPNGPNSVCAPDYAALGIAGAPDNYNQDKIWSYEAGAKTMLAVRTLSIDGAGYYIDWSDIQQTITLPTCGFKFTTNVGDAASYGGEIQLRYAPRFIQGLNFGLNAAVNRSVITHSAIPSLAAVGQSVLFAPERTATVSIDQNWQLDSHLTAFIHGDYDFTGHAHGSYQTDSPNYENPAYGLFNATLGVDTGTLRISLYGKNLGNNHSIIQRPQVNSVIEAYSVRPLTIGVAARQDF